jgi:hypothetical protein
MNWAKLKTSSRLRPTPCPTVTSPPKRKKQPANTASFDLDSPAIFQTSQGPSASLSRQNMGCEGRVSSPISVRASQNRCPLTTGETGTNRSTAAALDLRGHLLQSSPPGLLFAIFAQNCRSNRNFTPRRLKKGWAAGGSIYVDHDGRRTHGRRSSSYGHAGAPGDVLMGIKAYFARHFHHRS